MSLPGLRALTVVVTLSLLTVACGGPTDAPTPTTPQSNGGTTGAPTTTVPPNTTQPVSGRPGTATVTIGDETWELGEFLCTSVGLDFSVLGGEGDMYLDMRSEDDSHLTKFGDFAGEGWESTAEIVVNGSQVSVSGDFRHLDTGDLVPGSVTGTCK